MLKVKTMTDAALKLQYGKLTASRTDVYNIILQLLQQLGAILSPCSQFKSQNTIFVFSNLQKKYLNVGNQGPLFHHNSSLHTLIEADHFFILLFFQRSVFMIRCVYLITQCCTFLFITIPWMSRIKL